MINNENRLDMNELGFLLKQRRKELGLRLEDVADSLISTAIISMIERGKVNHITPKVHYLCKKLRVDLDHIMKGENKEDEQNDFLYHKLTSAEHLLDLQTDSERSLKEIGQLKVSEKNPYYSYLLLVKGKGYIKKGQILKAITYFKKCIQFCQNGDGLNIRSAAYSSLAMCHYLINELENALTFSLEGLKAFKLNGQRQYLYYNLQVDEVIYLQKLGRDHEALYKLRPLFKDKEKLTIDAQLNLYELYGRILMENDPYKACEILSQGLEIARKNNSYHRTVELSVQLGRAFEMLNKVEIAEVYYELALSLKNDVDYKAFLMDAYVERSKLFLQKGDIAQAKNYLFKGLEIGLEYNDKLRLFEVYQSFGILFKTTGDIPKAIEYLQKSIDAAEQIGLNKLKEKSLVFLIDCYKKVEDQKNEIELLKALYETKKAGY